jgi:uncharacterized coiled-coil protein SlyX
MSSPADLERRLAKLEARVESMVDTLNKVNQETANRVRDLERKFSKLDKSTSKLEKTASPKAMERDLMKLVDSALASYDKATARKG